MAQLLLALLGSTQVRVSAGRPIDLPSRGQALLAYLALRAGVAHPREKLATLLWADAPADHARHNLRQTLLSIRRAFPRGEVPGLTEAGGGLIIDADQIDVDVHTFERLIAHGTPESLAQAAAHYRRGDLLEGLSVQSPPFEEWLMVERERLRELAVEALAKLLAHHERTGALDVAVQSAIQLLGLDSVQEPVHRTLMRLYVRQGRPGAALRHYQHCAESLRHELGVEPEPATKGLYQDILQGRVLPAVDPGGPGGGLPGREPRRLGLRPDVLPAETALVGRQAEIDVLRRSWEQARAGQGRVLALMGEAGAGKSRLLLELAGMVWSTGGTVLLGYAHESTQAFPFGPWIEALRTGGVIEHEAVRTGALPGWHADLARLFPELGSPPPARAFEETARLFEALTQLVLQVAARGPLLLALEDLHWTDEASSRLLGFLCRRIDTSPVLVAVTAREENLAGGALLERVLEELRRERRLLSVPVRPLSREDTSVLVRSLSRARVEDARLAEQVWMLSGGNAFTVVETMRALGGPSPGSAGLSVPAPVRDVIEGHLQRVSRPSRELVHMATVIGRPAEFSLLTAVSGSADRDTAEAVEELVRRRIFVASPDGIGFAHERIRRVAAAMLSEPRRRALHAAVAAVLEARHAGRLDEVAERLAFHLARSDQPERAIPHLSRLAEVAVRAFAHVEAVAALQEAIAILERGGTADRDGRILTLVLRLTLSLSTLGRFADIMDLLAQHRWRLERVGDSALTGAYEFRLGMTCTYLGDLERATAHARAALEAATRCGDIATSGKARYMLGLGCYYTGRFGDGVDHARQAETLLQTPADGHWLGLTCHVLALNLVMLGQFDAGLEAALRAVAIGEATEDLRIRCTGAWVASWIHATRGDPTPGIEWSRRAVELAADPVMTGLAARALGHAYLVAGDAAQAVAWLEQAARDIDRAAFRQSRGLFLALLAEAYRARGDGARARETAAAALDAGASVNFHAAVGTAQRVFGRIDLDDGNIPGAMAGLGAALATFEAIGAEFEVARTRLDLAEAAAAGGDRDRAGSQALAASRVFANLGAPRYVEQAEALASRVAVSLPAGEDQSMHPAVTSSTGLDGRS